MLCGREPEPAWICSFSLAPRPHGAQIWSPCQLLPKPQAADPDVNTRSEAAHSLSVRQITIYYPTISSRRAQIFGSATVCAAPVAARSKASRHFGFLTKPYSMLEVLRLVLWTQPRPCRFRLRRPDIQQRRRICLCSNAASSRNLTVVMKIRTVFDPASS